MTEYQLPETSATLAFGGSEWESEWISSEDAYSAEQMQQAYAAGRESMRQECVKAVDDAGGDNTDYHMNAMKELK